MVTSLLVVPLAITTNRWLHIDRKSYFYGKSLVSMSTVKLASEELIRRTLQRAMRKDRQRLKQHKSDETGSLARRE